ncbi:histidine kinase [Lactococcus fujiensis JCM 16395]|uniref:histidine kinase n=1 Tax=Lactococcus fujiensis JCM 16395 TaxID=1291764 RepID=A0A2A5RNM9_9LACT|nr:histidine kinase [Lactococcus fujiensis JCM 16395]
MKIAEGAPYSRQLSSGSIILTSPIYEDGQIKGYLKVTQDRTQTFFINSLIIFFALLIYLTFGVITVERSRRNYVFTQNIIAKIKNIERSPLTQSYLIGDDTDRISVALNHLGETIQRQLLSHAEKKENLYEFIEFFSFPIFVYNGKGSIRKTNAVFKNDFSDTQNLDIFSPYAEFLRFLVDKMLHPDIQEKVFYFEQLSAYYQVRITPLPELDNRFIVTMMDITRYQKTLEAHNTFIANVSHELKTPLTSIKGFAELLENDNLSKEERQNFAAIINKETNRLMNLVHDTLLLTKQNHRVEKKKLDAALLIQGILNFSMPQIQERQLQLETQIEPVKIKTNEPMIHSIFENLIENAIKYTQEGGKIFVSLTSVKGRLIFSVTDNGHGLTEIQKERIFDRFYRADESRSQVPGTGLGLAIVQKNVTDLGGKVDVVSVIGKGTTFTVKL